MLNRLLRILVLTSLLWGACSPAAPADTTTTTVNANTFFRAQSVLILQEMVKRGKTQYGSVSIPALIAELETVEWRVNDQMMFLAGSGGYRSFAINLPQEKKVIVNKLSLPTVPDHTLSLITMHEALMATRHLDEDYQLTMLITWLGIMPPAPGSNEIGPRFTTLLAERLPLYNQQIYYGADREPNAVAADQTAVPMKMIPQQNSQFKIQELRKNGFNVDTKNSRQRGGGATSIGGGGDPVALMLKLGLLTAIQTQWPSLVKMAPRYAQFSKVQWAEKILDLQLNQWPEGEYREGDPLTLDLPNGMLLARMDLWIAGDDMHVKIVRELILDLAQRM